MDEVTTGGQDETEVVEGPPKGEATPPPAGGPPRSGPPPGPGSPGASGPPGPGAPRGGTPLTEDQLRRRERARVRSLRRRRLGLFARAYSRVIILVVVVLLVIVLFGLPRYRRHNSGGGPGLGDLPPYTVEFIDSHTMHVLTDVTDPSDIRLVFDEARDGQRDGDWWDVVVQCASVPDEAGDPALATGRFANTANGQSVTGLGPNDVDFELMGRTSCAPTTPDVPGAVAAEDVYAAVRSAGLRVVSPRDGSDACAQIDCLERTLTDQFTVIVWPDGEAARHWADLATIDVWQLGPVTTVQVNEGGFDPDGPERFRYETVFADLAAAHGTPGPAPATSSPVGDVTGT